MPKSSVFVSYSHDDFVLIKPLVSLLRASHVVVFLDRDTIRPGKRWRDEISQAIGNSTTLAIFWCAHSCQSAEVRKEYEKAIALGKDVLPLLLDDTPLPPALSDYQYIDFQPTVRQQHRELRARIGSGSVSAGLRNSKNQRADRNSDLGAAAKRALPGLQRQKATTAAPPWTSADSTKVRIIVPGTQYSKRPYFGGKANQAIPGPLACEMARRIESEIVRRHTPKT